jgi:hypothetical protein
MSDIEDTVALLEVAIKFIEERPAVEKQKAAIRLRLNRNACMVAILFDDLRRNDRSDAATELEADFTHHLAAIDPSVKTLINIAINTTFEERVTNIAPNRQETIQNKLDKFESLYQEHVEAVDRANEE